MQKIYYFCAIAAVMFFSGYSITIAGQRVTVPIVKEKRVVNIQAVANDNESKPSGSGDMSQQPIESSESEKCFSPSVEGGVGGDVWANASAEEEYASVNPRYLIEALEDGNVRFLLSKPGTADPNPHIYILKQTSGDRNKGNREWNIIRELSSSDKYQNIPLKKGIYTVVVASKPSNPNGGSFTLGICGKIKPYSDVKNSATLLLEKDIVFPCEEGKAEIKDEWIKSSSSKTAEKQYRFTVERMGKITFQLIAEDITGQLRILTDQNEVAFEYSCTDFDCSASPKLKPGEYSIIVSSSPTGVKNSFTLKACGPITPKKLLKIK